MPSVAVLYLNDTTVAPALELLRNVCDPKSRSRPHVTVRYFDRLAVPPEYFSVSVTHIDLIEAETFEPESSADRNRVVFVRCEADELTPLEHKPHFPASEFHITIFEGKSRIFAERLERILESVPWGFRVPLPAGTKLTSIEVKQRSNERSPAPRHYSESVKQLFLTLFGEELTWELIANVSDRRRLTFARRIAKHLRQVTSHFERVSPPKPSPPPTDGDALGPMDAEVHLTPPELARDIALAAVRYIEPECRIDFGDPAVGTGAFYAALMQVVPRTRIDSAIGIDINSRQVVAAQRRWERRGMTVMRGDYLHMERLPLRNLVLANPPFLRHQSIPELYKRDLRQRASVSIQTKISARSGLYVYFLILSHRWLAPNAISAWLIPAEFMRSEYGKAVRDYLTRCVTLLRVHRFAVGDPQFENAKVLPSVVIFRNSPPTESDTVAVTSGGSLSDSALTESISVAALRQADRWMVPLEGRRAPSDATDLTIRDLFVVKRGIATGANSFFILERCQALDLGIPPEALRPVLPKVKTLKSDIIAAEPDGYPSTDPQLALIDCDLPEDEIARKYPGFMRYLREGIRSGITERTLVRERRPWYRQDRRDPAPFVCTYMGRGTNGGPPIRFLWNRSSAVATNTYLLLYPVPSLTVSTDATALEQTLFDLLRQAAVATVAAQQREHAGGLFKIEPSDLLDVRLPAVPSSIRNILETRGDRLHPRSFR